jgi:16S rRNA G527 N7-methylase RsmG
MRPSVRAVLLLSSAVPRCACCASVLDACARAVAPLHLPAPAVERALGYVEELLAYNERTNVYSKTAYGKLPFHVADSLTLALDIRDTIGARRGVLDLGSGSGLPSVLIACVNPELPVFAVESKSRKTRAPRRWTQRDRGASCR